MRVKIKQLAIAALATLVCLLPTKNAYSDDTSQNISIPKFVSNMKLAGDMRVRDEEFWKGPTSAGLKDRSRQRFRLRFGLTSQIEDFTVIFRMASGTGEQVSTNQTFTGLFGEKALWIDLAAVQWKLADFLTVGGGRMINPFWRTYASDLVWDDDINPEGFSEQLSYTLHERLSVFGNFGQFVTNEISGDTRDQWVFGNQVGIKVKILDELKDTLAFNYIRYVHENTATLGQVVIQDGNSGTGALTAARAAGSVLGSNYTPLHLTNELGTRVWRWPFSFQTDYVVNNGDTIRAPQDVMGYQIGGILNKAAAKMSWEAAYFFKYVEFDATLADVADSDFGDNGGTNRKGHIMWLAFNPREYLQFKAKLFVTDTLHPEFSPGTKYVNRLQVDMSVKF